MKPAAVSASAPECTILCVTDRKLCEAAGIHFQDRIRELAAAGIPVILREKDLSEQAYQQLAQQLLQIYIENHFDRHQLVLHYFIQVAAVLQTETIHLPLPVFREICSNRTMQDSPACQIYPFSRIGVSVHSVQEAQEAAAAGADYLIAGHIFATECKKNLPPRGITFLKDICHAVPIPVYAIGGISGKNLPEVRAAGAAGACIRSGFMQCGDISAFLKGLESYQYE